MSDSKLDWAMPVMRAGYAGRGVVYLVVAGISLWAIWRGGEAEGTSSAMKTLETTTWGGLVLAVIALGMLAYFAWRWVDAIWDLEDYGTDSEGLIARAGMFVTGAVHLGIGILAVTLILGGADQGSDQSKIVEWTGKIMGWPGGRWIVLVAGVATVGAGLYYLKKSWAEDYREHLQGNEFTANWNWVLQAGVAAQGVIVTIVGVFFVIAGWQGDSDEAGGVGEVFSFLRDQPFGNVLVIALCLGLLGFAVFCFVNAKYRIVPKLSVPDVTTLKARLG